MSNPWDQFEIVDTGTSSENPWDQFERVDTQPKASVKAPSNAAPQKEDVPIVKYGKQALGVARDTGQGIGEAALSQVTGQAATAYGGLKGLLRLGTGGTADQATKDVEQAQNDYTYQPRGEVGKGINTALAVPGQVLETVGGAVGKGAGWLVGQEDAGEAIGKTLALSLPVIYGGKAALKSPVTAAVNSKLKELINTKRPSNFGASEQGSIGFKPSRKTSQPAPTETPTVDAEALKKGGWSDAEIERIQRFQKQKLTPTLGDITREPSEVRFGDQTAAKGTAAGGKAYQVYERKMLQNDEINNAFNNLKDLDKKTSVDLDKKGVRLSKFMDAGKKAMQDDSSKIYYKDQTGEAIRNDIEAKRNADKQKISNQYRIAEESGHTGEIINAGKLDDFFHEVRNGVIDNNEVGRIIGKWDQLKNMNMAPEILDASGNVIRDRTPNVSIRDLEHLRKEASTLRKNSPQASFKMKEIIDKIDDVTDGYGGNLYKEARKSSSEYFNKYKNLKGVKDVTNADHLTKEFNVPSDRLFDDLVVSNKHGFQGFKNAYDILSPETQRIVGNQVIQHIQDAAYKGQETLKSGKAPYSPQAIKSMIDKIGKNKLTHILGEQKYQDLLDLSKSATELKAPSYRVNGSDTGVNMATRLAQPLKEIAKRTPGLKTAYAIGEDLVNRATENTKISKYLNPISEFRGYKKKGSYSYPVAKRSVRELLQRSEYSPNYQDNKEDK